MRAIAIGLENWIHWTNHCSEGRSGIACTTVGKCCFVFRSCAPTSDSELKSVLLIARMPLE
jgi:hypothetical protein